MGVINYVTCDLCNCVMHDGQIVNEVNFTTTWLNRLTVNTTNYRLLLCKSCYKSLVNEMKARHKDSLYKGAK